MIAQADFVQMLANSPEGQALMEAERQRVADQRAAAAKAIAASLAETTRKQQINAKRKAAAELAVKKARDELNKAIHEQVSALQEGLGLSAMHENQCRPHREKMVATAPAAISEFQREVDVIEQRVAANRSNLIHIAGPRPDEGDPVALQKAWLARQAADERWANAICEAQVACQQTLKYLPTPELVTRIAELRAELLAAEAGVTK